MLSTKYYLLFPNQISAAFWHQKPFRAGEARVLAVGKDGHRPSTFYTVLPHLQQTNARHIFVRKEKTGKTGYWLLSPSVELKLPCRSLLPFFAAHFALPLFCDSPSTALSSLSHALHFCIGCPFLLTSCVVFLLLSGSERVQRALCIVLSFLSSLSVSLFLSFI